LPQSQHRTGRGLHGDPTYTFDAERGVMRCGQTVAKTVDTPYGSDMKLGE